jgi:hypothetical protein
MFVCVNSEYSFSTSKRSVFTNTVRLWVSYNCFYWTSVSFRNNSNRFAFVTECVVWSSNWICVRYWAWRYGSLLKHPGLALPQQITHVISLKLLTVTTQRIDKLRMFRNLENSGDTRILSFLLSRVNTDALWVVITSKLHSQRNE